MHGIIASFLAVLIAGCAESGGPAGDAGSDREEAEAPDSAVDGDPGDASCLPGETLCSGRCVNTSSDHANCGGCGHACLAHEVCFEGECMVECPSGWTRCEDTCKDTDEDPLNCGDCGHLCEAYETCVDGACTCEPDCGGKVCGGDGCAGQCPPGCESYERCTDEGRCELAGDCFPWSGTPALASAVSEYECVEIQAGTFRIDAPLYMPGGHTLRGLGRDVSVLGPSGSFSEDALVIITESNTTLDGFRATAARPDASRINLVLVALFAATRNAVMENMQVDGAACDGVSMGGTGTTLQNSLITGNGGACWIGVGGGVYAETGGAQESDAPRILGNTIQDNAGTAVDINNVDGGEIRSNVIQRNGGIAGIAIYQGYGWTVEDNTVYGNGATGNDAHPRCHVPHPVGIWLCRDEENYNGADSNRVSNNRTAGYYGIILIGADEDQPYLVPRFNTLTGNDVFGSTIGCADDYTPGQWTDGDNLWSNNNCRGTPDTLPDFF